MFSRARVQQYAICFCGYFFLIFVLVVLFPFDVKNTDSNTLYKEKLIPIIAEYIGVVNTNIPENIRMSIAEELMVVSSVYRISVSLLVAVVYQESHFYHKAVSPIGAIGLGQINPYIWLKTLQKAKIIQTKQDLFDIRKNLFATAFILRKYLQRSHNSVELALARYNGLGSSFVKQYIKETLEKKREFTHYLQLTNQKE